MRYILVWQGEEIDEFDTRKEAIKMAAEYMLAFKGEISIRRKRATK